MRFGLVDLLLLFHFCGGEAASGEKAQRDIACTRVKSV